jgi:hypothetical protein
VGRRRKTDGQLVDYPVVGSEPFLRYSWLWVSGRSGRWNFGTLSLSLGATGTITVDGSLRVLPSTFLQLRLVPARLRFFDITHYWGAGDVQRVLLHARLIYKGPCSVL